MSIQQIKSYAPPSHTQGIEKRIRQKTDAQNTILTKYGKALTQVIEHLQNAGSSESDIAQFLMGKKPLQDLVTPKSQKHNIANLAHFKDILKLLDVLQDKGGSFGALHYIKSDIANVLEVILQTNKYFKPDDNEKTKAKLDYFMKYVKSLKDKSHAKNHANNSSLFAKHTNFEPNAPRDKSVNQYQRNKLLKLNLDEDPDVGYDSYDDSSDSLPDTFGHTIMSATTN